MTRLYVRGTHAERLRARLLEVDSGCIEYQGHRDRKGYGRFGLATGGVVLAHRLAYELAHGSIPAGLHVLHHCDNPPCCNPAHLFVGTLADNNRDMREKGRGCNPPHRSGEAAHNAKLTEREVREIKRRYVPRVVTGRMLAAEYGVTVHTIRAIIAGRNWAQVTA